MGGKQVNSAEVGHQPAETRAKILRIWDEPDQAPGSPTPSCQTDQPDVVLKWLSDATFGNVYMINEVNAAFTMADAAVPAVTLDTGASCKFVSEAWLEAMKILYVTLPLDEPKKIRTANGTIQIDCTAEIPVLMTDTDGKTDSWILQGVHVAKGDSRAQLLLGMDFVANQDHKVVIDFRTGELTLKASNQKLKFNYG